MNTDNYKSNKVPVMWKGESLEKYLKDREMTIAYYYRKEQDLHLKKLIESVVKLL